MRRAKFLLASLLLPSMFASITPAQNTMAGKTTATKATTTASSISIPFKRIQIEERAACDSFRRPSGSDLFHQRDL